MADKQISQLVAATTINNDDLFVMQQGGTAKKLSGQKLSDFVYQSAADQIERVNEAVEQTQAAVDSLEEQKNEIAQTIASMAELGTDTTLTTPAMAADAAATGEVKDIALARFEQAEITGVPIATFDDGADDVPVKKLVMNIEPVQDLHGQANPWPAGGGINLIEKRSYSTSNVSITFNDDCTDMTITKTQTGAVGHIRGAFHCDDPTAQYTWAAFNSEANTGIEISVRQENADYSAGGWGTLSIVNRSNTFTPNDGATPVYWQIQIAANTTVTNFRIKLMIVKGNIVPTSYSPYSNICPITGWTGANVTRTGKNLANIFEDGYVPSTSNGQLVQAVGCRSDFIKVSPNKAYVISQDTSISNSNYVFYYTSQKAFISFFSTSNANYTFTTPEQAEYVMLRTSKTLANIRNIQLAESSTATAYEPYQGTIYEIEFPSEAGTVYGGTLDVTNGVLTVDRAITDLSTITWTESPIYYSSDSALTGIKAPPTGGTKANAICENYPVEASNAVSSGTAQGIGVRPNGYLYASKYGSTPSGNIVYELVTPITYTLTPTEVTTLLALNNIWADTGNINDLIYRKMPIPADELENTLESMIAGVEHTMEATQNYTEGDLVIAVHKLYYISSNIASGETLVPGTNCRITTIADELTNIMAIVDGYFNALGNLATLNYQVVT